MHFEVEFAKASSKTQLTDVIPMLSRLRNKLLDAKCFTILICSFLLLMTGTGMAAPRIKVLKLSITNPTNEARLNEDVVISVGFR